MLFYVFYPEIFLVFHLYISCISCSGIRLSELGMRDYCRDKFLPVALPLKMMSKLHFVSEVQIHFCILVCHRIFNALSRCRLSQWWKIVACPAVMIIVWIPVQGLLPVGWLIDRKVWAGRNLTPRIKHIYTIPSQTDSNRIAFGLCFCVYVLPHPIEIRINTEPRLNFVVND